MARTMMRLPRILAVSLHRRRLLLLSRGLRKQERRAATRGPSPLFRGPGRRGEAGGGQHKHGQHREAPRQSFSVLLRAGEPGRDQGQLDNYLRRFFGDVPDRELKQRSLGSGVIIDRAGYIVTNYHVVRGAEEITVRLMDGREFKAKVVGRDPKTDLSLIKIAVAGQGPSRDPPG